MSSPQRRILTVLSLVQVIGGIGNGAGLAIGALLIKDISGSEGWAGTATVALTLGAALFTVPLATLAARRGRRPALTAGWWLGSLGAGLTVAAATLVSLPLALLGLLLFGASTAANLQSRFAAADRAEPSEVGRAIAVVAWSTTIGAVTGPNLTAPGAAVARMIGVPDLVGPLVFSVLAYALAGSLTWAFLRPDPLRNLAGTAASGSGGTLRRALPHIRGRAAVAVLAVASSHAVMVSVMALTPVHMEGHGSELSVIGLTISLHIAGMYALSPFLGWLADRAGADTTILLGQAILLVATLVAGTAGHSEVRITAGLILLGLGWSASVIAAAALLTRSVDPDVRPVVQGFSDLAMNLCGAAGGLLAGLVVALLGFGALNVAAALPPVVIAVLSSAKAERLPTT